VRFVVEREWCVVERERVKFVVEREWCVVERVVERE